MFEQFTFQNIMQRMLDRVPADIDKREGSIIWDALAPAALELEFAYISMDYIFNQSFAITAERPYLILRALERGVTPYEASCAVLKAVFTPADCDVIGKRFNLDALNYVVTTPIEGEPGAYQIVCETAGESGNNNLGSLIPIEYVEGLETATAVSVLIPGEDEEETEAFRARYVASLGEKPYGGNVQDYITKVNEIEGVGGVRVTPTWQGGGTVLCTILDGNYQPASEVLIETVQTILDPTQDGNGLGIAPIGHVVTIIAPETVEVNVKLNIEFDTGFSWANMQQTIHETLEAYLFELRKAWGTFKTGYHTVVRISQIETRLLQLDGILDVRDTSINGAESNLVIQSNDVPVLGVIGNVQNG